MMMDSADDVPVAFSGIFVNMHKGMTDVFGTHLLHLLADSDKMALAACSKDTRHLFEYNTSIPDASPHFVGVSIERNVRLSDEYDGIPSMCYRDVTVVSASTMALTCSMPFIRRLTIDCNDEQVVTFLMREFDWGQLSQLTHITFGSNNLSLPRNNFNQPLGALAFPPSIISVTFGVCYGHPLDEVVWPRGLRFFEVGDYYNHSLDSLPDSTERMIIGDGFNQSFARFPLSLTYLMLGRAYNQSFVSVLSWPRNLQTLIFIGGAYNFPIYMLPSTITYLHLSTCYNQPIDVLPASLVDLILGLFYNLPIDQVQWPVGLRTLRFMRGRFNHPLVGLPDSLVEIDVGDGFDHTVEVLPPNTRRLVLGNGHTGSLSVLPPGLQSLVVGSGYTMDLALINLPAGMVTLTLTCLVVMDLSRLRLPPSVKVLRIGTASRHRISLSHLPSTLEEISFRHAYIYFDELLAKSKISNQLRITTW